MTILAFDESALVHQAPRWIVPLYYWFTRKVGAQRVLRLFSRMPAKRKRIGICVFSTDVTTLTADRRHCLVMQPQSRCWAIYRATSDLQRWGWHGIEAPTNESYVSDNLLRR